MDYHTQPPVDVMEEVWFFMLWHFYGGNGAMALRIVTVVELFGGWWPKTHLGALLTFSSAGWSYILFLRTYATP